MTRVALLLLLAACAPQVFNPEGYACDPGNICPTGFLCVAGVCHAQLACSAATDCTQVPASECPTEKTARRYQARCTEGACFFDAVDEGCSGSCQRGMCLAAPCVQGLCTAPPSQTCRDGMTQLTYDATGVCDPNTNMCRYDARMTTCANGCVDGLCQSDECATVTCQTPPRPTCVGQVARTFSAVGTCSKGMCTYASSDVTCANGCSNGQCQVIFVQTHPGATFPITALDLAPGSMGTRVLVTGPQGQLVAWNGQEWKRLQTPPFTGRLNAVYFTSDRTAYVVGERATVWRVEDGVVTNAAAPGGVTTNYVAVHGRGVPLIVSETGAWATLDAGVWSSGTFPSTNGPFSMKSAYVDEYGRERVAGRCGSTLTPRSCVVARDLAGAMPFWFVDEPASLTDTSGFTAVGPYFDVPSSATVATDSFVARGDRTLARHQSNGDFSALVPALPSNVGAVVGFAPGFAVTTTRSVYVATARTNVVSPKLYRLDPDGGVNLIELYTSHADTALSLNHSAGVLFAESYDAGTGRPHNAITRYDVGTERLLDFGDSFTSVTADTLGTTYFGTAIGDALIHDTTGFTKVIGPNARFSGAEARNGTGVLFVGRTNAMSAGVWRFDGANFQAATFAAASLEFTSVCRVSDSEAWAVGTQGLMASIVSTGALPAATRVMQLTTNDLNQVACVRPGVAFACGARGTVLELKGAAGWSALSPAFPNATATLTSCVVKDGALYVAGDGVFGSFDLATRMWTQLPPRAGLRHLVVRAADDVFADVSSGGAQGLVHFSNGAWADALPTPSLVWGGVQVGTRMVWAGDFGLVVEGR